MFFVIAYNGNALAHVTDGENTTRLLRVALLTSSPVVLHLAKTRKEEITHYTNTNTKTSCDRSSSTLDLIHMRSEQLQS